MPIDNALERKTGPHGVAEKALHNALGRAGGALDGALAKLAGEPSFGGKTIRNLAAAEGRASAETLARNGLRYGPFIKLDEARLGELLMHFMPETIIAAHLTGIVQANRPAPLRPVPSHGCVRPSAVHFGLPLCRAQMEVLAVSPLYLQRHWTIPAFDQPAVEEGKVLAKKYLTGC